MNRYFRSMFAGLFIYLLAHAIYTGLNAPFGLTWILAPVVWVVTLIYIWRPQPRDARGRFAAKDSVPWN